MSNGTGATTTWAPGDIAAETNTSKAARLIQFGQWLRSTKAQRKSGNWRWNHIIVVTSAEGDTIEAQGAGVVQAKLAGRDVVKLNVPADVDRAMVVRFAQLHLGLKYNWVGVILQGVDCLLGTKFHWASPHVLFCSELGCEALEVGGWRSPRLASETKPVDLVDELGVAVSVDVPA